MVVRVQANADICVLKIRLAPGFLRGDSILAPLRRNCSAIVHVAHDSDVVWTE